MSDQTNADLIEEGRLAGCSECAEEGTSPPMRCDGDLIRRLTDALESAERVLAHDAEASAAALLEVEDFVTRHYLDTRMGADVLSAIERSRR